MLLLHRRIKTCFTFRGPGGSRIRMSWKAVFIILFIMVVVLGTYMKYFERPSGGDTILQNRNLGNFEKPPSFFKGPPDSLKEEGVYDSQEQSDDGSYDQSGGYRKQLQNLTQEEIAEKVLLNTSVVKSNSSVDDTRTANETDLPNHGITQFDWDGWVKDNNFVNIGSIWGYCDDKDPVVVGKIVLFNDGGSLSVTAVFNTTFDSDIHGGSAEGRVKYYDSEMYHKTYDICELAEKYENDLFICPIPAGDKYFLKEKAVSWFIPRGEYTIELTMKDETGKVLLCAWCKLKI